MTCLTMSDYMLARHWVEITAELEQRRAQRPDLIDSVVTRAELDHRNEIRKPGGPPSVHQR